VVGLLAGLLLFSATPALADRRKSTITLGVDPDGVAIQIDATRSGDRRTAADPVGGGGTPCTYTLASTGSAGLYVGKPADVGLFTVACGSYVDVRWLRLNPNGTPQVPGPTVDPFQLALSARDRLPIPTGGIGANPARSLVGLPTWFWYSGYDGRPLTKTVTAFGVSVQVQATPTSYRWDFGDGTRLISRSLGRPYPARSPITHTYLTARAGVRVRCVFAFALRWRTGGGPWALLPPLARTATATLEVAESQAVIHQ
jgi:hypothetical protein